MDTIFHSVTLDSEKCKGCINCIKRCPTQAIRVRNGKASIINERCIDCGECIRVCQNHAKLPVYDPVSALDGYKYKIALPAPALYGQFNHLDDVNIVLNGLLAFGFDEVFEVAKAAEIVSDRTRSLMEEDASLPRPVISSACPAVVRLIRVRFPELLPHLLPLVAPIELAARMAVEKALKEHPEFTRADLGVVFISPCAAKVTSVRNPLRVEKSSVDAVFAIKDVYPRLLACMKSLAGGAGVEGASGVGDAKNDAGGGAAGASQAGAESDEILEISSAGRMGISWCGSGGESAALLSENYLAADGIENVIKVLEELEDEKLGELDFIELNACAAGCVGGVLTVENPYVANTRIKKLRRFLPISLNHVKDEDKAKLPAEKSIAFDPIYMLSDDYGEALARMERMKAIVESLPGLDCGSCGAPTCEALAEDVVRGLAKEEDCIFKLRDYVQGLMSDMNRLQGYIPPPFRKPAESMEGDPRR